MDCRPPGSSVHRIFQARILEQIASYSKDPPNPGTKLTSPAYLRHWQVDSLPLSHSICDFCHQQKLQAFCTILQLMQAPPRSQDVIYAHCYLKIMVVIRLLLETSLVIQWLGIEWAVWKTQVCFLVWEIMVFPDGSMVKNLPAMQETQVQTLGWEDPLEEGMATHSSILAWEIPWTEDPGGATVHGVTNTT